jgi:glycerophosphoryl diester phosphodiesterase
MTGFLFLGALLAAGVRRPLDLQGHRGARGLAPENTLAAFARALSIGVTTLELDAGITRDGVVVVSHDPELNPDLTRGPDGAWLSGPGPAIWTLDFDTLRRYDVGRLKPGSAYKARFPEQTPADGERIPSLKEVIALTRRAGNNEVRFNVETKIDPRRPDLTPAPEAFAEAVLRVVREEGVAARTTLQSFDWRTLAHARKIAPDVETVCLTVQQPWEDTVRGSGDGPSPFLAGWDPRRFDGSLPRLVKAFGAAAWSPHFKDVGPRDLEEAHRLGIKVIVWTVNDPAEMATLIDRDVDGIITDRPDLLRSLLAERGLSLPRTTPVTR